MTFQSRDVQIRELRQKLLEITNEIGGRKIFIDQLNDVLSRLKERHAILLKELSNLQIIQTGETNDIKVSGDVGDESRGAKESRKDRGRKRDPWHYRRIDGRG